MRALTAERERRGELLRAAGVSKWEGYRGGDLPLLVVYVSELSLLQDATSKAELEQWLNSELAAGRAFGIRYIIATQTASNFATRWRSQVSLFLAGVQPSDSQDEPNTGLRTAEIRKLGAVPPSDLPGPPDGAGVFCAVCGRQVTNVRAPYLSDAQRRRWLQLLPDRVPVPTEPVLDSAVWPDLAGYAEPVPASANPVPADTDAAEPLYAHIRALAAQGMSRNQICAALGGNRARTLRLIDAALRDVAAIGATL